MMTLEVPLVIQAENSLDCGLGVVAMLLRYYGVERDICDLKEALPIHLPHGTYSSQLGLFLLKEGFEVTLIGYPPALYTNHDLGCSKGTKIKRIQDVISSDEGSKFERELKMQLEFLREGGQYLLKVPSPEDVRQEIESGCPILVTLTSRFMNGDEPKFNYHWNVITGIDDQYIYVNDPAHGIGGKKKHPVGQYFFGIHAISHASPDWGSLLCVRRKDGT